MFAKSSSKLYHKINCIRLIAHKNIYMFHKFQNFGDDQEGLPFIQIDMSEMDKKIDFPEIIPVVTLINTVLFPGLSFRSL